MCLSIRLSVSLSVPLSCLSVYLSVRLIARVGVHAYTPCARWWLPPFVYSIVLLFGRFHDVLFFVFACLFNFDLRFSLFVSLFTVVCLIDCPIVMCKFVI